MSAARSASACTAEASLATPRTPLGCPDASELVGSAVDDGLDARFRMLCGGSTGCPAGRVSFELESLKSTCPRREAIDEGDVLRRRPISPGAAVSVGGVPM